MIKPVAVRINESKCPPLTSGSDWIDFDHFEMISSVYSSLNPKYSEDTWVHITVMFDNENVIDCGMYLNKEGNINFMELATDLFSSMSLGQIDDDAHEVLWPLMSKMEFTYH